MPSTLIDSTILGNLVGTEAMRALFSDDNRTYQAGNTRVDVHDRTSREVDGTFLEQKARGSCRLGACFGRGVRIGASPVPHHMCDGQIREGEPKHHEQQRCGELDTVRKSTQDQAGRDGRECQLERTVDVLWNDHAFAKGGDRRIRRYAAQEQARESAEEGISLGKGDRVAI